MNSRKPFSIECAPTRPRILPMIALSLLVMGRSGWAGYEYWDTDAYRALPRCDQIKLDRAHDDFHLL